MIYLNLKFYFKKKFKQPPLDFKFSDEDNAKLITYLYENFTEEYLVNLSKSNHLKSFT